MRWRKRHRRLARVDSHLRSVTSERKTPLSAGAAASTAKTRGFFSGVLRALGLSVNENAMLMSLPEGDPLRKRLFTPVVRRAVESARDELSGDCGPRWHPRRAFQDRRSQERDARLRASAIGDLCEHLYANLPGRKARSRASLLRLSPHHHPPHEIHVERCGPRQHRGRRLLRSRRPPESVELSSDRSTSSLLWAPRAAFIRRTHRKLSARLGQFEFGD